MLHAFGSRRRFAVVRSIALCTLAFGTFSLFEGRPLLAHTDEYDVVESTETDDTGVTSESCSSLCKITFGNYFYRGTNPNRYKCTYYSCVWQTTPTGATALCTYKCVRADGTGGGGGGGGETDE